MRHLVQLLAIRILVANSAHSSVCAFYLLYTAVGNGTMNKFISCFQWRSELTQNVVYLRRQGRNERSGDIGNGTMMPVALLRPVRIHHVFPIPTARWIFLATLRIRILIADSCARWRRIFKRLSQDGVGRSLKFPCLSLFSNKTSFSYVKTLIRTNEYLYVYKVERALWIVNTNRSS